MEDEQIISLYWARSDQAIPETDLKYGAYCRSISFRILDNREDSEECVSDAYLDVWNAIPPTRPRVLSAFLGKIVRRISIDRWRRTNAAKRGGGTVTLALEELGECVPDQNTPDREFHRRELKSLIDRFLDGLPETERNVFLSRYWHLEPVEEISDRFRFSRSKTTSMLFRIRQKLKMLLEQEGYL